MVVQMAAKKAQTLAGKTAGTMVALLVVWSDQSSVGQWAALKDHPTAGLLAGWWVEKMV